MKVVLINAIWCGACIITKKNWQKIKEEYPDLEIANLDYDFDEDEVSKHNPGTILPVAIFFDKNGNEITRLNGEKTVAEIKEVLEEIK